MKALLEVTGLSKRYGGVIALDGVDLSIGDGGVHAVIGPNGAGKSTLVNLICGRQKPDRGSIRFQGTDITNWQPHRRIRQGIGYTFQITSIFGAFTCRRNIEIAAGHGPQVSTRVDRVLRDLGLDGLAEVQADTLAYGHQRLLEIGMGLVQSPRLLILDEPTQGLSDAEIAIFNDLVRRVAADRTVLLIEHNMAVVMALASRITVLNDGRLLADGAPGVIRADERVQRAYLGTGIRNAGT